MSVRTRAHTSKSGLLHGKSSKNFLFDILCTKTDSFLFKNPMQKNIYKILEAHVA